MLQSLDVSFYLDLRLLRQQGEKELGETYYLLPRQAGYPLGAAAPEPC